MKTRAALALSVAGVLLTGGAAFATTQSLSNTGTGTSDDARNVLVTDDSATKTPAVSSAKATTKAAATSSDDTQADDKKHQPPRRRLKPAEAGDDKGGLRTTPSPATTRAEPRQRLQKTSLAAAPSPLNPVTTREDSGLRQSPATTTAGSVQTRRRGLLNPAMTTVDCGQHRSPAMTRAATARPLSPATTKAATVRALSRATTAEAAAGTAATTEQVD